MTSDSSLNRSGGAVPSIAVAGLGTGDPDQLTLGIWRRLQAADAIYVRTAKHPMMDMLRETGVPIHSFDRLYEQSESFPEVYDAIADELIRLAKGSAPPDAAAVPSDAAAVPSDAAAVPPNAVAVAPNAAAVPPDAAAVPPNAAVTLSAAAGLGRAVLYAVPGHPMVAERTVQLLRERCPREGVELTVLGGESFLDIAFTRLGFDPIEGFQLLDAAGLQPHLLQPQLHTLIGQVYDGFTASDVKLTLMERYPEEHPVTIGHALGVAGEERIVTVPLYELDRGQDYGNLSLVYVPASNDERLRSRSFDRLHEIVSILRSPDGCPWDREQTHQSIRKNFIEELYEALEAIDADDPDGMREEFGDVILQVMLHSQMEEETGAFTVYDVIQELNEKLIFRHPHVFGADGASDAGEALASWERMKAEEKRIKGRDADRSSVLDGVPKDLPALLAAYKLQKKASKVGFDWNELEPMLAKIEEELREVREAAGLGDAEASAGEVGDLLFAVVNAARFLGADPEEALARTNAKFKRRFLYVEEQLRINGKSFDQTDLLEMDRWWEEAKKRGL
ncbi:nucleoside triphosphate pyrophosphohydrolase [Paenibacillus sp. FSL W8-1187]|uniref:Nucleoside triphosphate pyrophosphohydrolase MazG n=1 Tax=Paenibacillus pasadenensis TaxID=217090 RepID=A0A2N5MZP6_9BACL|nr:nucleoside triphosphate pyrophosphohydrolase [Paenibacillus pasadenensis]PLT43556.1 Nucleoside triphosphate pyrophosphohydrolase MazG [Paenibacillus pasadenensis]